MFAEENLAHKKRVEEVEIKRERSIQIKEEFSFSQFRTYPISRLSSIDLMRVEL